MSKMIGILFLKISAEFPWFFVKFLNFSKNSEILTQAKASYSNAPHKCSEFFDNPIKSYEFFYFTWNLSIYDFSPRGFTAKFSINSILKK